MGAIDHWSFWLSSQRIRRSSLSAGRPLNQFPAKIADASRAFERRQMNTNTAERKASFEAADRTVATCGVAITKLGTGHERRGLSRSEVSWSMSAAVEWHWRLNNPARITNERAGPASDFAPQASFASSPLARITCMRPSSRTNQESPVDYLCVLDRP